MTEKETKINYKTQHDTLSESYYNGKTGLTKEEFDSQHGAIWEMMRSELITEGFITIPEPPRDLAAEIDELKTLLASPVEVK